MVEVMKIIWSEDNSQLKSRRSGWVMVLKMKPDRMGPAAAPNPATMWYEERKNARLSGWESRRRRLFVQRLMPAQNPPPRMWRRIGMKTLPGRTATHAKGRKTATQPANCMTALFFTRSEIRPQICMPVKSAKAARVPNTAIKP